MTSLTTRPAASPTTSLTARPVVPAAALSLAALEAAMLAAAPCGEVFDALVAEWTARLLARVVTGDDGLDHYL